MCKSVERKIFPRVLLHGLKAHKNVLNGNIIPEIQCYSQRATKSWSHKQVGYFKSQLEMAKEITHLLDIGQDNKQ